MNRYLLGRPKSAQRSIPRHTCHRAPLWRSKGQGHQTALLIAALTREAGAAVTVRTYWALETTYCHVASARWRAIEAPVAHGRMRGAGPGISRHHAKNLFRNFLATFWNQCQCSGWKLRLFSKQVPHPSCYSILHFWQCLLCPATNRWGIKRCFVWRLSVAYIGPSPEQIWEAYEDQNWQSTSYVTRTPPLSRSKCQGHQVVLLSAALRRLQRSAWERIRRGKYYYTLRLLGGARQRDEGRGCRHADSLLFIKFGIIL